MPKTKEILKGLGISVITFIILFLLLEIFLIVVDYPVRVPNTKISSENPLLVYINRPYAKVSSKESFNSDGLRDREYNLEKPVDTVRIAILGDSVAYGDRIDSREEIFSEILEYSLNLLGEKNFEVINFGVGGYNIVQEVELYNEKASRYNPDIIILAYVLNDPDDISMKITEKSKFKTIISTLERIRFVNFFYDYSYALRKQEYDNKMDYIEYLHSEKIEKVRSAFQELGNVDKRVVVVLFPVFSDFAEYKWEEEHDIIGNLAREMNFEFLDLFDAYSEFDAKDLRISKLDVYHPNELGHKIAADAIYDYLSDDEK